MEPFDGLSSGFDVQKFPAIRIVALRLVEDVSLVSHYFLL